MRGNWGHALMAMKRKASRKTRPTTIDEYLSTVSADKRAVLQRLRRSILAAAPRAEECISYQMPGFRLDGRMLVWFGAGANHCAFYPGGIVDEFKDDLTEYETSKGTIRFQPDHPLPAALVRKLVNARIGKDAGRRREIPAT